MANEAEVAELKRIIEDERQRRLALKRASHKRRVASMNPEELAAYRAHRVELSVRHVRRSKEKRATRPKPTRCEVCQVEEEIIFDHDHRTTAFRGWLCKNCNLALGYAKDDPIVLEKLAVYLRTHGGSE